jgi:hypothetical protein
VLLVRLFTNVVAMISCSPGCLDQVIWLHISTGNGCVQGAKNGWYDGTAIGVAVILVISVTGNVHLFLHSTVQLFTWNSSVIIWSCQ